MQKFRLKNRKGLEIVGIYEEFHNSKGLAFVSPGLSGSKEQPHMQVMHDALKDSGYNIVIYDPTNSMGESGGEYENATTTNYYNDLEDVIDWAKKQSWYQEPFVLAGHSLGSLCIALYSQDYPSRVKAIAPISTMVSGKLKLEAYDRKKLEKWRKTGWRIEKSSKPGIMKKLKWNPFEKDLMKYDLLKNVEKSTMPALLVVGENDNSFLENKILYDKIPNDKKEFHIIKGSPHTFREPKHLQELKTIFLNWIKRLN